MRAVKREQSFSPANTSCTAKSSGTAHCRSELAREKPESAAINQGHRVIVDDFREQARAYTRRQERARVSNRSRHAALAGNAKKNGFNNDARAG